MKKKLGREGKDEEGLQVMRSCALLPPTIHHIRITHLSSAIISDTLTDLGFGVHYKWTVRYDRFIERLAAEEEEFGAIFAVEGNIPLAMFIEHHLIGLDCFLIRHFEPAMDQIDKRVMRFIGWYAERAIWLHGNMIVKRWGDGFDLRFGAE